MTENNRFISFVSQAELTSISHSHDSKAESSAVKITCEMDINSENAGLMLGGGGTTKQLETFFWGAQGLKWYGVKKLASNRFFDVGCYFKINRCEEYECKLNTIVLQPQNEAGVFKLSCAIHIREPSADLLYVLSTNLKHACEISFDQKQLQIMDQDPDGTGDDE